MSGFGEPGTPPFPYRLLGVRGYKAWAASVAVHVRLEVDVWISGLYISPWQAPSFPLRDPGVDQGPPDDLRRADLDVSFRRPVVVIYDVWENLRNVRLLYLD